MAFTLKLSALRFWGFPLNAIQAKEMSTRPQNYIRYILYTYVVIYDICNIYMYLICNSKLSNINEMEEEISERWWVKNYQNCWKTPILKCREPNKLKTGKKYPHMDTLPLRSWISKKKIFFFKEDKKKQTLDRGMEIALISNFSNSAMEARR